MSKRYILVKVSSHQPIAAPSFEAAMVASVRRLFGDFGLSLIDPKVIRFDVNRSEAIVSCNAEGIENLQAALGLISEPPGSEITALTIRVSGTIKGIRRKQRF
jgi:RNase P/RNase MRP subunit POP5